jgi:hypothetical protein
MRYGGFGPHFSLILITLKSRINMFIKQDNGKDKFELIPRKAADVSATLEPAVYTLKIEKSWSGITVYFERNDRYKGGVPINTGVFAEANEHFNFFISKEAEEARKDLGLMDKMALIFNGGPGTGKTFLAGQMMEKLVREKNAICIMSKGEPSIDIHTLIDSVRLEDPNRWVGILIDEYEKSRGNELDMLSFLDGTNSRNNVLLIATVNSTKMLPETIINRIGRIERVYNFDTEDAEVIKAMIVSVIPEKYKDKINAEEISLEFIEYGIKPSIDFITVLIRNKIYELLANPDKAPELLDGIRKQKETKKGKKRPIGFKPSVDQEEKMAEKERDDEDHANAMTRMENMILQQFMADKMMGSN